MNWIEHVLDGSLMPHGHCLLWRGDLLFLHLGGDGLTTLAYLIIPTALIYLVRERKEMRFDWMTLLFAAFILLCGITHAIGILNIWHGYYFIAGVAKIMTGIVSIITAYCIWRLIPVALSIPSRMELVSANEDLLESQRLLEKSNSELEERVRERTAELEELALTDPLTKLSNRRALLQALDTEMERYIRLDQIFSILLVDLDHFKAVNDKFGHLAGDLLLQDASGVFRKLSRKVDIVGRYGGEEFLFILPGTNSEFAYKLAERVRKAISDRVVNYEGDAITYSCSIGTATIGKGMAANELLKDADTALYRAKDLGRNRVV